MLDGESKCLRLRCLSPKVHDSESQWYCLLSSTSSNGVRKAKNDGNLPPGLKRIWHSLFSRCSSMNGGVLPNIIFRCLSRMFADYLLENSRSLLNFVLAGHFGIHNPYNPVEGTPSSKPTSSIVFYFPPTFSQLVISVRFSQETNTLLYSCLWALFSSRAPRAGASFLGVAESPAFAKP